MGQGVGLGVVLGQVVALVAGQGVEALVEGQGMEALGLVQVLVLVLVGLRLVVQMAAHKVAAWVGLAALVGLVQAAPQQQQLATIRRSRSRSRWGHVQSVAGC